MNDIRTAHPDQEMLAGYALGRLDDAASLHVERHLADCSTCKQALEQIGRLMGVSDIYSPD